jgi:ATP-binding cassette subfamily B protein
MSVSLEDEGEEKPDKGSVMLAARYYWRELTRLWRLTLPAMLGPALGNIGIYYLAPLLVAQLVTRITENAHLALGSALPYVFGFTGILLFSEVIWRIGMHFLNRLDALGIEHLYVVGLDELFAKDSAFFHDNFAGSLTKRVLSFASRFEQTADTLVFEVVGNFIPLAFGSVVLWYYDPWLVIVLLGMIAVTALAVVPIIRRRQAIVNLREAAIARVAGHVADSLTNIDTVRAFAAEHREAAEHRSRVAQARRLSLRSWDYNNLRVDTLIAPMSVLTNGLGLLLAITLATRGQGVAAIVVVFSYYSNATRIMFEFSRIYRNLESGMTEAAQFTALMRTPPTVLDRDPLRTGDLRLRRW